MQLTSKKSDILFSGTVNNDGEKAHKCRKNWIGKCDENNNEKSKTVGHKTDYWSWGIE